MKFVRDDEWFPNCLGEPRDCLILAYLTGRGQLGECRGRVTTWLPETNERGVNVDVGSEVTCMKYIRDWNSTGGPLVVGTFSGELKRLSMAGVFYDGTQASPPAPLTAELSNAHRGSVLLLRPIRGGWSGGVRLAAAYRSGDVCVWDENNQRMYASSANILNTGSEPWCMRYLPGMQALMSGTREGRLLFFDFKRTDKARLARVNTVRRMRGSIRECNDKVLRIFAPPEQGREGGPEVGEGCVEEGIVTISRLVPFAAAPSGQVALVGTSGCDIIAVDPKEYTVCFSLHHGGYDVAVIKYIPLRRLVVAASRNGKLTFWKVEGEEKPPVMIRASLPLSEDLVYPNFSHSKLEHGDRHSSQGSFMKIMRVHPTTPSSYYGERVARYRI